MQLPPSSNVTDLALCLGLGAGGAVQPSGPFLISSRYTGFPSAQLVKNLPAMQKTHVQSLGQEGPLEKGMATHSSILAWRIPWTEELAGYSQWGRRVRHH